MFQHCADAISNLLRETIEDQVGECLGHGVYLIFKVVTQDHIGQAEVRRGSKGQMANNKTVWVASGLVNYNDVWEVVGLSNFN